MLDNKLLSPIQSILRQKQYLTFSEYMEIALYHPEDGYYMQAESPLGRDFVTAPMLSSLFAKAVSSWLEDNDIEKVLEIGAGNGWLAGQILESSNIVEYNILDRNPKPSQEKLSHESRCRWINRVGKFQGAIIANELLDALPFRRFCMQEKGLFEFVVTNPLEPEIKLIPVDKNILPREIINQVEKLSLPYSFEYQDYRPFFESLKDFSGKLLLMDYGYEDDYFHQDRSLGTMMCYQKHRSVPFSLEETGLMDITCAVNWNLVKRTASAYGFVLDNIGPQSDFILSRLSPVMMAKSVLPLLLEHEMGQFVKVSSWNRD